MSNNPSPTLDRPARTRIAFCLASRPDGDEMLVCTRIDDHEGHCCDEVAGKAWVERGWFDCRAHGYDHSAEKGLRA
jgi:hypothetical protein